MKTRIISETMIGTIYSVILIYFMLGAIAFYLINRKKPKEVARENQIKFGTYFVIITILFFSIVLRPNLFTGLAWGIIVIGCGEMIRVYLRKFEDNQTYFVVSMVVFGVLSAAFISFTKLDSALILYAFLILSIFDSFSQISGQLFGKNKILPLISPNKTVEGLAGGLIIAVISGFLLYSIYDLEVLPRAGLILGIVSFAFGGDVAASWYKRVFEVKDFSALIPGHGGFLDRFDSLIAGGAWVTIWYFIIG